MHKFTVDEKYAGKNIVEVIEILNQETGKKLDPAECFVSVDGKIVEYPIMGTTIINHGQELYIFSMPLGG